MICGTGDHHESQRQNRQETAHTADPTLRGAAALVEAVIACSQGPIGGEVVPSVVELRDGGPGVMVRRSRA